MEEEESEPPELEAPRYDDAVDVFENDSARTTLDGSIAANEPVAAARTITMSTPASGSGH